MGIICIWMASNTRDIDEFFQGECLVRNKHWAFQGRVSEKEPGKGTERTFGKVSDKSGKCGVATDKLHVSRTRVYSVSRLPCGPGVKD